MESDSSDDSQSDSGVSADFSPCSTSESNTNISNGIVFKETPIEKEIRRNVEREKSLRRSRGLPNLPSSPEYVDIPLRKTTVCQSLTTKSERKDRELAGKKMQHEIHEETQREQVLVQLGKVPGFYDKGTVGQLEHRKQVFEAFQKPSESTFTVSTRSKTPFCSSASDISTLGDTSSEGSTVEGEERRLSVDLLSPKKSTYSVGVNPTSSTPQRGGFSKVTGDPFIIPGSNLTGPTQKSYTKQVTTVDSGASNISSSGTGRHGRMNRRTLGKEDEEETEVSPKDNPFFKLRSSKNIVKVERDIREAQEREKELHKQRISLYGGEGVGRPTMSSSSMKGLAVLDSPESPRCETGPSAAHWSPGKLNMWIPAQAEEKRTVVQEVRRTSWIPRQKNPLVERWESGLINDHNKEED
ncbi:hypothetical protein JOB18_040159 [Solea senegalensis]|uniref:A-kinase anchor protein 2 C-terminal domain-containing protein n=1 Tax=Solea senegalensis TaxID=28829 RepID=A0AAV6QD65_SOLSE|nr:uncharacterized protein LOC122770518 [Solea senegalensis]KAG7486829.1 hypothetical protein JOB18_040159 [Solea senegalensis]